ncbi:MAG: hypothetical protein ACXQTN_07255 [Methanoculleaceae archaeon]
MNDRTVQIGIVVTSVAILTLAILLGAIIWGCPVESARYPLILLAMTVVAGIGIIIYGWRSGA